VKGRIVMAEDWGSVTLSGREAHAIATLLARLSLLLEGERYPNDLLLTYDQVYELGAPDAPPPQQLAAQLREHVSRIEAQLPADAPSVWPA
jgi:Ser/Thr protein kinase RdoA (MazF antagonist)